YTLSLTPSEIELRGRDAAPLRMRLSGADPSTRPTGEDRQASTTSYFTGRDAGQWRTAVPNYSRVRYRNAYPGIDLVYYGNEGNLEYDWIVSPGADPHAIQIAFETGRARIDRHGDLLVSIGGREYRHRKPVVYQESAGRRTPLD